MLRALGADLVLTDPSKGMTGAVAKAKELSEKEGMFLLQQFGAPKRPPVSKLVFSSPIS